jgi:hypothetical protein
VSYVLIRDQQFISVSDDHDPIQLVPWPLLLCSDSATAWISFTIEQALERAALLQCCWGLNTEIRALR